MNRFITVNNKDYEITFTNKAKEILEDLEGKSVFDIALDMVVGRAVSTKIKTITNMLYAGFKSNTETKHLTRDEVLDLLPTKSKEQIIILSKLVEILLEDTGIKEQFEAITNKKDGEAEPEKKD